MKTNYTFLLFSLITLILLNSALISGASPFTQVESDTTLKIWVSQFTSLKYNTTYSPHVHISNSSNGYQLPNNIVDCYIHIYDMTGSHIYESPAFEKDSNGQDLEIEISGGNLTEHDETNSFFIWCNSTTGQYGEGKGSYQITANGKPIPEGIVIVSFIIILIIIFVSLTTYLIRAVGLIVEASFDIMDIAYAWGLYFGLLGVQLFAKIYLGNVIINNFLNKLVIILAFPFVIVPVVAFFLSLFRTKKKKKEKEAEW